MNEPAVLLAALGIVATISGALIWLLKKLFTQNETTITENTKSTRALAESISKLASTTEKQIDMIKTQEKATKEWQEYVVGRFDNLDHAAEQILNQTVRVQTVQHQTVINKE